MRGVFIAVLLGAAWLAPCSAAEAPAKAPIYCVIENREPLDACIVQSVGGETVEAHAARGETFFRALIFTQETIPTAMVTLSRAPSGESWLRVQALLSETPKSFDVVLAQAVWQSYFDRWKAARNAILNAPLPSGLCITAAGADFEVVQDGLITRASLGGCQAEFAFVAALSEQLTNDIPQCASLPAAKKGEDIGRLAACVFKLER